MNMLNLLTKLTKSNKYTLILIALEYEFNFEEIKFKKIVINKQTYFIYKNFIVAFTGVGKVNAARTITCAILTFNIKQIINIGSACTINSKIFNVNVANFCQYGDVDATADINYKINQIPYENKYFDLNNELTKKIISLLKTETDFVIESGGAMCVDSFVTTNNINSFYECKNKKIKTIDMESTAIAQICSFYNKPLSVIKVISDKIKQTKNNHSEFNDNLKYINTIINTIFNVIVTKLI